MCFSHDAQYYHYGFLECDVVHFCGISPVLLKKKKETEEVRRKVSTHRPEDAMSYHRNLTSCIICCEDRDETA
jgi:hypothetical protein